MEAPSTASRSDLLTRVRRVCEEVVAPHADDVDRKARFPAESIDALREERLLGAYVPAECGGGGYTVGDIGAVCQVLGQSCASTAMIYAMHQIQVACIVHHGRESEYFREYLGELAERQRLIASATSEIGVGGDLRSSVCAVNQSDGRFQLEKKAPVISYGEDADDILVTARRAPDAPASDQSLVLVRGGEYNLDAMGGWDTLGFRGTCSLGFLLTAQGPNRQIVPEPFGEIASQTMLPVSHIVWTSLWLGIATDAVNRARAYIRKEARKRPDVKPAASLRLAEVYSVLQGMRANVLESTEEYERRLGNPDALSGFGFAIRMNNLKIACSQLVVQIVSQALQICGITGYKNDSEFTLGRHLRDAYGAALMINNDRILGANASMLLVHKDE